MVKLGWYLRSIEVYNCVHRVDINIGQHMSDWFFFERGFFRLIVFTFIGISRSCFEQIHIQLGPVLFVFAEWKFSSKNFRRPIRVERERIAFEQRSRSKKYERIQAAIIFDIRW